MMIPDTTDTRLLALLAVLSSGMLGSLWYKKKGSWSNLLPGPPSLPVLGNVLDIRSSEPWIVYKKWAEKYGDVFRIRLFTQDAIVLNSLESAKALLEQRSQNYSSRPYLAANEMLGADWNTAFLTYCDKWRLHRKVFQQPLRAEGVVAYRPAQLKYARVLTKNVLEAPLEYREHFQTFATSVIMSAAYGYHTASRDDPVVTRIEAIIDTFDNAVTPELSAIFNMFPWLMYIPSWFPGAGFQRTVLAFRASLGYWLEEPFKHAMTKMSQGSLGPCLVRDALERIDESQVDAHEVKQAIKEAAATSYGAASDTTASVLQVFVLAMTLHPEVQKRAQKEIEAIVGPNRLPNFSDRPNLPYVEAVLRETLRWHPVVPLSLPHCNISDDTYSGYMIPKGTTVIPNVWAMAHDETKYPDSLSFKPTRFFDNNGALNNDTVSYVFGFGRRVCIGRYLAEASLWSAMVNLLAIFVFRGPDDPKEQIVPCFTTGLTSVPEPFDVQILPRLESEKLTVLLAED